MDDLISRQQAIDALDSELTITGRTNAEAVRGYVKLVKDRLERLPSATDTNVGNKLGTNLAEVGTDCISRQAAIDVIKKHYRAYDNDLLELIAFDIERLPPVPPNTDLQNLAEEIAAFKRSFKSVNSDYLTGYLSALSVVEGMIAERKEHE